MDPGPRGIWAQGGGNVHSDQQGPRPGAFGPGQVPQQLQQSPPAGHASLPPPNGNFSYQQQGHGLGGLSGLTHSSPRQPPPAVQRPDGPGIGFSLPALSQAAAQPLAVERERERARDIEQIHIKEEQDRAQREQQERQRLDQAPPLQAQPGQPMHLHQPVAVGPRHGLLGNPGLGVSQAQPGFPLGAPSGPSNIFAGGPVQAPQGPVTGNQQQQPGLLMPFAPGPPQQSAQQQGAQHAGQAQGQGQQPILNDALSYLDQVKVQFADHPDVYNRFLDIMKDFKSGAIDTPGVIGRVSQLFAGNPELIQGFNTFLPPGYRIECGAGDDPNAIRVTTPMGTTVQSMPQPRPLSQQEGGESSRRQNGTYTPQPGQGPQMILSPSGRAIGPILGGNHLSPLEAARQQEQQAMHQQQERGVNHLQNAVSAAASVAALRAGMSPAPGRLTPLPQDGDGQAGMEKRGPVEFNHAISYVNKIKNRFSSQPDIYKQFLEILQTYQRESKPIQDVYSQVTHLFKTAPDLLDDFKQFLPESAAAAKAHAARLQAEQQAMLSHVRGEPMYGSPVMSREVMGTPSHGRGLPPVGNFAPTPTVKDNKRKRGDRQGTVNSVVEPINVTGAAKGTFAGPSGKRAKQAHAMAKATEQPPSSPSLIPALPFPLAPTTSTLATSDELSFFDRAKKAISNKNTFNEFLKLCNLFSQDLIDRTTLIHKARSFVGSNPELLKWFMEFVGYEEKDILVENKPRIPGGRVSLSNCRGLGPSYRLLPKRERQKICSGRDELCNAVLNDEWASHPTWASEDSGFVAHRKNTHEEGLHRIEEERHDYDYNIEACSRTVQLLEPLAQQLLRMSTAEQVAWQLPQGLGGQSETIYKRVIMKVYGREMGHEVCKELSVHPYQVIPVLLNRLKERLESWRLAQREWEKVWREQTQKMFWKSLDHQSINARNADKRAFQMKTLQSEIQVKHEEMVREEKSVSGVMHKPQLHFAVEDTDVVLDVARLVLTYLDANIAQESPKLPSWMRDFLPTFFGIDPDHFNEKIAIKVSPNNTPAQEMADDVPSGAEDASTPRARKAKSNNTLFRSVLTKGPGKFARKDREESNASASRASTPDVGSAADDEMTIDTAEEGEKSDNVVTRWLEHPASGNNLGDRTVDPSEPFTRHTYHMWANSPMYCFVRMLVMIYDRLLKLKKGEAECRKAIARATAKKPAIDLGIVDKLPTDFFDDVSERANYYGQMLDKFEKCLTGEADFGEVEDILRRFYLQSGYQLYSLEKMVQQFVRYGNSVVTSDGKEKSIEIYGHWRRDRMKASTTATQQTDYRKMVERQLKDSELYRIDYNQSDQSISFYLTKKDDPTFDDTLSPADQEHRWRYYIASYTSFATTEGVALSRLIRPALTRNLRASGVNSNSTSYPPSPTSPNGADNVRTRFASSRSAENLVMRITVNTYHRIFEKYTQECFFEGVDVRAGGAEGVKESKEVRERRDDEIKERWELNNDAMKNLSREAVEAANEGFAVLIGGEDSMEVD